MITQFTTVQFTHVQSLPTTALVIQQLMKTTMTIVQIMNLIGLKIVMGLLVQKFALLKEALQKSS